MLTVLTIKMEGWSRAGPGGRCCRSLLFLFFRCLSCIVLMLVSASSGNKGKPSINCARSKHTSRVDVVREGNAKVAGAVSVLANNDIGALMASAGRKLDRQQHERLGYVVDRVSLRRPVLLSQLRSLNCFALAFWFPMSGGYVLLIWIAKSFLTIKAIWEESTCRIENQYSLSLRQMEESTLSMKMLFRVDSSQTFATLQVLTYKPPAHCTGVVLTDWV